MAWEFSALGRVSVLMALVGYLASCNNAPTAEDQIDRGRYLVTVISCGDCHTPGALTGMPDPNRLLGGADVSFFLPGMGYFYPPNLTPDGTGLGSWTTEQIVTALRTGMRPDGRLLAPIMPWRSFANLTDQDANAIAAYLKSLPPVMNQIPAPIAAGQMPPGPAMAVVAPPSLTPVGLPPSAQPAEPSPTPATQRGGNAER